MFPHVIIGGGTHEIFVSSIFLVFMKHRLRNKANFVIVNIEINIVRCCKPFNVIIHMM